MDVDNKVMDASVAAPAGRLPAQTRMGAVALVVADLVRSLDFYRSAIGLELLARTGGKAVLGAGGRPLLRLQEQAQARLVRNASGLYHLALRLPSRRELARTWQRLQANDVRLQGAADHLVSEALYLADPDGHGIELYCDRPRAAWYDERGAIRMATLPLDGGALLETLAADDRPALAGAIDPATEMGHVHLQVADIAASRRFYDTLLGFDTVLGDHAVAFLSAGGYHHHLGMNTWVGRGVPPPPESAARMRYFEILLPDAVALQAVVARLAAAGHQVQPQGGGSLVRDPSQIGVLLRAAGG